LLVGGVGSVLWLAPPGAAKLPIGTAGAPAPAGFTQQTAPLFARYCTRCHGGDKPKAGLALDPYPDDWAARKDRTAPGQARRAPRRGDTPPPEPPALPPPHAPRPLQPLGRSLGAGDGGRVTVRRLNRTEYNNTVRDLVGVSFRPADDFPADDVGYGFDNIG